MFVVLSEHVFRLLRGLHASEGEAAKSAFAHHMRDARLTIPTPALLAKVVDLLDTIPMDDRDTKGDLYEYMLGKIARAGQNGQFRTPRHIIQLMHDLSWNRYREVVHAEVVHRKPAEIVAELESLEVEIAKGTKALARMLAS